MSEYTDPASQQPQPAPAPAPAGQDQAAEEKPAKGEKREGYSTYTGAPYGDNPVKLPEPEGKEDKPQ